jgi:predicted nucleotidyltransferase
MTSISYNLSGKVDSSLVEVLQGVNQVATALGIRFFVVGAMARIIVLEYCHAIRPARGTRDLDIAVEVDGWNQFHRLSAGLVATGNFTATREPQAFRAGLYRVDIVPFGGITGGQGKISWPPEHEVFMSTMGFEEAYECAMTLRMRDQPALDIKVPTIPGLALMKVISWHDRYPERPKDAEDLLLLMNYYADAGNEERLYVEEDELLQAEGFDLVIAGIRLLGRDMALIANDPTGEVVASILKNEIKEEHRYRLVQDMIKGARIFDEFSETLEKLKKLAEGFNEGFRKKNSHSSV